jgi:hypothetical protein
MTVARMSAAMSIRRGWISPPARAGEEKPAGPPHLPEPADRSRANSEVEVASATLWNRGQIGRCST